MSAGDKREALHALREDLRTGEKMIAEILTNLDAKWGVEIGIWGRSETLRSASDDFRSYRVDLSAEVKR